MGRLIDFNSMSTRRGLFYAYVHYDVYIYIFVLFPKIFFCSQLYPINCYYLIQIISTQLFGFKYSYLIQIII